MTAIYEATLKGRTFLVAAHANPDGDAVGSTLALGRVLEALGREVVMYNADPTPEYYRFLPGWERIVDTVDPSLTLDVMFVLDCSEPRRLGEEGPSLVNRARTVINLDHHLSEGNLGDIRLTDVRAAATGVLLWRLFNKMDALIDRAAAECLYTALITDTGSFRHSNTNTEAFEMAADMLALGADAFKMSGLIYATTERRIRLLGLVISSLTMHLGGKVATLLATDEMFDQTRTHSADLDGILDHARAIDGVEVAALLRPLEDGQTKVSLRSKGGVNVAALAEVYGGGGHHNAAGLRIAGDIKTAEAAIIKAAKEALAESGDR